MGPAGAGTPPFGVIQVAEGEGIAPAAVELGKEALPTLSR
jgi:hypothetical protein